jgi:hypothetical protein
MFNSVLEHRAGPTKTVAGIEQAIDLRAVFLVRFSTLQKKLRSSRRTAGAAGFLILSQ